MVNIMAIEIVGKYEAVVKSLNIARRALEEQAIEIEELTDRLKVTEIALAAEQAKHKSKAQLSVAQLYRFPKLTPGL